MSASETRPAAPAAQDRPYRAIFEAVSDGLIIHDHDTLRIVEANEAAATMHGYSHVEFIGLLLSDYLHADSQPLFIEAARALEAGGVLEASAIHLRRDGTPFHVEVRRTAFTYRSRPCLLSIVRDVSKRVKAEELHQQQEEARRREQSTVLDISHTLASTLELKPDLILDQLGTIVQYSRAALFVVQDSALVAIAVRGVQEPEGAGSFRIRLDAPEILTGLFNEHRPIRIADVSGKHEQAEFLRSLLGAGAPELLEGVRAWMWVPLAVKDRILGGMGVAHAERDYFTRHHADLALTVANQAAITMVNAQLYQDAKSLAALQERQRLARNLHDAVNQSLFSAGLIAEVLPRLWDRDQQEARRSLEDLRTLTRGAMAEMRALLAELRPSTLIDAELGDLLHLLASGFTGRTSIPAKVTVVGQKTLPADVQVALYRVCQEALNNVAKHAGASNVEIKLEHAGTVMELSIRDNGQGFDPRQAAPGHYGLNMMRERAEAVGASLSVTSQPGGGTELTIRWAPAQAKEA
jgi:two-component system nitrate/nitrite sensor histidine kinase NarX